ncbi:1,3-beta-galactosyl-N-acetylhexosamine phosphorylase [Lachnospiraceae bacterium 54-53]
MTEMRKGSFTLPGESGYEELTLKLAERWGADVIRDSDGTALSAEITGAGYGIYSTICLIRDHNEWAAAHPGQLQQTFLSTEPRTAGKGLLMIRLMEDFFGEQFRINDSGESMKYWQVFDRTTDRELSALLWTYDRETGSVVIGEAVPFHQYTVSFLAYRIWEEISMYNHVTNHWEKEHLMPVDPRHEETGEYLCRWLRAWCEEHPATTVVRFTSLFYNFAWIWGSSEKRRNLFSDWGSYDFTVSPKALKEFEEEYGYALTAEDFINQGKFHVTHMPPGKRQLDYMAFVNRFVLDFGKKLVELVHSYKKKAYVFYDDSWIGLEPYNGRFKEFGFDGLIKCVFSGYEARLCAGAEVETHELRLHPYLFPVGLGGAPTFCPGGDPVRDAKEYWNHVRRALLREKIDRIGLGGYLHLVEDYPDFCSYMEKIAGEFRLIKSFHENGEVYSLPLRTAVLHSWGSLRSWTLSGHFHETHMHDLIHVNEALSGLPVLVDFINFDDIRQGALKEADIVINAGAAGTAWSGGGEWADAGIIEELSGFVHRGGVFLGINEPSALEGYHTFFRMSQVLGLDEDTGARVCHGRWDFCRETVEGLIPEGASVRGGMNLYLTSEKTHVLAAENGIPTVAFHESGRGCGIYLSSFRVSSENTRLLLNLMLFGRHMSLRQKYLTDNPQTECAWYPQSRQLVVINNSESVQRTSIETDFGVSEVTLEGFDTVILKL